MREFLPSSVRDIASGPLAVLIRLLGAWLLGGVVAGGGGYHSATGRRVMRPVGSKSRDVMSIREALIVFSAAAVILTPHVGSAQDIPQQYQTALEALGKSGDFRDAVLKVNIPRTDLRVTIGGRPAPTPFGFGGWIAMTTGTGGHDVLMGDLVLTEDEVNPVMSAVLDNGLEVTALHNHFFWEQPRIFYMHVHGMGTVAELTKRIKPALALIDAAVAKVPKPAAGAPAEGSVTGAAVAKIVGHEGEQNGPVYKITIRRPDINLTEHGAKINARMGLNTWAAFAGTDADAMVAGDVAMLEHELTPVLKALRSHGLNVVAIHHHMTGVQPMVVFLHYYGTGPAAKLAEGVRAAVAQLGTGPVPR
jgi:Domain of Unknown Function (DUF1259)